MEDFLTLKFGQENVTKILQLYPPSSFQTPWYLASRILGDQAFTCPVRRTARWLVKAGAPAVYTYFFTHPAYWIVHSRPWLGVSHETELPFVFNFGFLLHGTPEHLLANNVRTSHSPPALPGGE